MPPGAIGGGGALAGRAFPRMQSCLDCRICLFGIQSRRGGVFRDVERNAARLVATRLRRVVADAERLLVYMSIRLRLTRPMTAGSPSGKMGSCEVLVETGSKRGGLERNRL